tara:strand:- start:98 stop:628 length:531 start_codon:yes stop_codon:yes gene_type:complete
MALEVRIEEDELAPEVLEGMEQTAVAEDELVGEFQPRGNFTRKPLNALVVQTKKGQPLYGLKADYPDFPTDQTELPIEFVRILLMFKQSIDDAIVEDILDEEDTFTLEEITDDSSLKLLAGKLGKVFRNSKFKKFLATPDEEVVELSDAEVSLDDERTPLPEGSDETIEDLFLERV